MQYHTYIIRRWYSDIFLRQQKSPREIQGHHGPILQKTRMVINMEKSMMTLWGISKQEKNIISQLFPYQMTNLHSLKYMGFFFNPNQHKNVIGNG